MLIINGIIIVLHLYLLVRMLLYWRATRVWETVFARSPEYRHIVQPNQGGGLTLDLNRYTAIGAAWFQVAGIIAVVGNPTMMPLLSFGFVAPAVVILAWKGTWQERYQEALRGEQVREALLAELSAPARLYDDRLKFVERSRRVVSIVPWARPVKASEVDARHRQIHILVDDGLVQPAQGGGWELTEAGRALVAARALGREAPSRG